MDSNRVGARAFEPPTSCSQIVDGRSSTISRQPQVGDTIANSSLCGVPPSQGLARKTQDFTTRLLPALRSRRQNCDSAPAPGPPSQDAPYAPDQRTGHASSVPTATDLFAFHDGSDHLLTVRQVAQRLGVCAATVYRLCKIGDLPHIRIVDAIRVRPTDLNAFIASSRCCRAGWLM
jgi:excisionase family DNA binding protein